MKIVVIIILLLVGSIVIVGAWFILSTDSIQPSVNFHSPIPNTTASNTTTPQPILSDSIQTIAWLPYWDDDRVVASTRIAAPKLDYLSPLWYQLDTNLAISPFLPKNQEIILDIASQNQLPIIPTVGNELESQRVISFLDNPDLHPPAIDYLINQALQHGYIGWDIDWEQIPLEYADQYALFIKELCTQLHQNQLSCTVTVHALTGSNIDWVEALGHDYQQLAKFADYIRVMAYDYHFSASKPGPVTPLDYLDQVIDYSLENIPKEKLIIGLPVYGYDWDSQAGESIQYQDAIDLLDQHHGDYRRDQTSGALTGNYTSEGIDHTLWFEDAQSLQIKIDLVQTRGVQAIALWRLGGEDPEMW